MRYYYDCEFLENGSTIELISIGIVAEDGSEYYAVNSDMPVDRIHYHQWLMGNVVPHLPLRGKIVASTFGDNTTPYGRFSLDTVNSSVKPRWVIANEVRDFLLSGAAPELWAWYGAYDHVALCQLWGSMAYLPKGIPMWTNDLRQEAARLGYSDEQMPQQEGPAHCSLADARHLVKIDEFLRTGRGDAPA